MELSDDYEHVAEGVFYTTCNIPGKGCNTDNFNMEIATNCSCINNNCIDNNCSCIRMYSQSYVNKKLINDDKVISIVECNDNCKCNSSCENRVVQLGPIDNLIIIKTGDKGYGVVTKNDINRGKFICEYAGEVIGDNEARIRSDLDKDNKNYIFTLKEYNNENEVIERVIIDATIIGNIGRYINHSCNPNCIVIPTRVNSVIPKLAIFAKREIKANEEITYSYNGLDSNENASSKLLKPCLCKSDNCTGYLPYNP